MIVNDFMDTREKTGRLLNYFVRKLTRDPKGVKFYSRATITLEGSVGRIILENIPMIDEYVLFS
jgi:hypothetical protein